MKENACKVIGVLPGSAAEEAGIEPGDTLLFLNGFEVHDILEYRYLMSEYEVTVTIGKKDGTIEEITIESDKKKRSGKKCSTSYVNIECLFYSSGSIITVTLLPALLNSFMKLQMSWAVRELRMFI